MEQIKKKKKKRLCLVCIRLISWAERTVFFFPHLAATVGFSCRPDLTFKLAEINEIKKNRHPEKQKGPKKSSAEDLISLGSTPSQMNLTLTLPLRVDHVGVPVLYHPPFH